MDNERADLGIVRDTEINRAKPVFTRVCVKCGMVFETNHRGAVYCEPCDPCTDLDSVYDD